MTFVRNHALAWNRLCESLMMASFLLRGNGKGRQGRPNRCVEGSLRSTALRRFTAVLFLPVPDHSGILNDPSVSGAWRRSPEEPPRKLEDPNHRH
jgi:hypothetical protein